MLRGIYKYGLALCLCLTVSLLWAQKKTDRDYLRSGNRLYRDSMYTKAEVDYRKAIEANSRFPQAHFNLGNALLRQQKPKEAMQAYEQAVKVETNKGRLASIYHNMGVILQSQKQDQQNDNKENKDGKDKNKEEDKNSSKKDKQENKDKKEDQQKQQQKQSQQNEENMSKENAEQLLNAAMQDEKDTQERIRKAMAKPRQRKLEKQW